MSNSNIKEDGCITEMIKRGEFPVKPNGMTDNNQKDTPVSNLADVAGEEGKPMTARKDGRLDEAARELDALIDKQRARLRNIREGVERRDVHPSNLNYADGVLDGLREAKDVLLHQLYPEGDCRDVAV